jgi:Protein of unknown function (DUF3047)
MPVRLVDRRIAREVSSVPLSLTIRSGNRRPPPAPGSGGHRPGSPEAKSSDQRWFGRIGRAAGARVPVGRLRPLHAPATDLSVKGEDDCSLAVYVGFPYDPGQASFLERLKRPLVESWGGKNAPGRVLRYVVCGRHQRGEVVESPYLGSAGLIRVLRPTDSPAGKWFTEQVDLAANYRLAFGEEPPDPTQIAIQTDTDNIQSSSRAVVADLAFAPRPE